jgi:type IV fimbrial biogenesis protein FimT
MPPLARQGVGVTLLELLIALTIGALLVMLALPAYGDWIADYRLMNHARALAGSMYVARSEAIKRGYRVDLCKSADLVQCGGTGWNPGWIMYVDQNLDGRVDPGEPVLRREPGSRDGVTVAANTPLRDYVSYTDLGVARMMNGALQMGTFALCLSGRREVEVVLAHSGRVRIQKTPTICP